MSLSRRKMENSIVGKNPEFTGLVRVNLSDRFARQVPISSSILPHSLPKPQKSLRGPGDQGAIRLFCQAERSHNELEWDGFLTGAVSGTGGHAGLSVRFGPTLFAGEGV